MSVPQGSLVETAVAYVRSRVWLITSLVAFVFVLRLATMQTPPERNVDAIAAMLGHAVSGSVRAEDFVWEERGSFLHDAFVGRRVLFLATRAGGEGGVATSDLYRAAVRLTRGGRPIALGRVENLSATPRGEERDLVAHGHHAAYATFSSGVLSTITLLDLSGDLGFVEAKTRTERLRVYVENWIRTGAFAGIGRAELSFASPPKEAKFELTSDALVLALGPDANPAAVGLADETVNPGGRDEFGIRYQRLPHPVSAWSRFLEETTRAALGQGAARRVRGGIAEATRLLDGLSRRTTPSPAELPASNVATTASADGFPPARLKLQGTKEIPGEGVWMPASGAFSLPLSAADAPPAFFETAIRPDPTNPSAIVRLVLMDGRRLDLRPLPGPTAPRSETGLHGSGRIPASDVPIAVAAFAGGMPEGVESFGVVLEGQTIAFARPKAMTLAVDRFGHSLLDPWPFGEEVPSSIRSLRQAGAPLVVAGHAAPLTEADAWPRERSALGVTSAGHLLYAWGSDIGAGTLSKALLLAGCRDAMPLASSPDPVGFGFLHPPKEGAVVGETKLLSASMSFSPSRVFSGSATELVYVVSRSMRPTVPLPEGAAWEADAGRQPAPTWQPAVHTAKVTKLGVDVRLLLFAPERFVLRIRAGTKEASHRFGGTFSTALDEQDKARLSAAIGLGIVRRKALRGLAIGGAIGLRFGPGSGVLAFENGALNSRARIDLSESVTLSPETDAVELPLTANEGRPLPESRIVGSMRPRAALCVRDDGSILVASTTFDTDEATTEALVDAGCGRVVALDRGSHSNALIARAGTDISPAPESEQTTLYFLDGVFVAGGRLTPVGSKTAQE